MDAPDATRTPAGLHLALHGDGVPLLLGFPMMASHAEIFGDAGRQVLRGFLDGLTDRYRVLLVDYPSIGRSAAIPPGELTADRVCRDLLRAADAAGFDRFAYWGYSWGGAVGLQLASRTDRLSALVVGGWAPLGGHYEAVLRGARAQVHAPPASAMAVLREPAQYAQWVTFYDSVQAWPEDEVLRRLTCPRLVFVGADGDTDAGGVPLPIATTVRAGRGRLEALGWRVEEIPGRDFGVGLDPSAVVPAVRPFLDAVI